MINLLFLIALILTISWTVSTYELTLGGYLAIMLIIILLMLILRFKLNKRLFK